MKKTKKVISYIMLLVPLSLPAACSPIDSSRYSGGPDQQAETDESEQLRLIVERYFERQEQQQAEAAVQWIDVTDEEEHEDDSSIALESEQDLQDELKGLKETGEWTAVEPEGGTQCDLPAPSEEPVWPEKRITSRSA